MDRLTLNLAGQITLTDPPQESIDEAAAVIAMDSTFTPRTESLFYTN